MSLCWKKKRNFARKSRLGNFVYARQFCLYFESFWRIFKSLEIANTNVNGKLFKVSCKIGNFLFMEKILGRKLGKVEQNPIKINQKEKIKLNFEIDFEKVVNVIKFLI